MSPGDERSLKVDAVESEEQQIGSKILEIFSKESESTDLEPSQAASDSSTVPKAAKKKKTEDR